MDHKPVRRFMEILRRYPLFDFSRNLLLFAGMYFLIELLLFILIRPDGASSLLFGIFWSLLFSALLMLLPFKIRRITFGATYYIFLLWALAQAGYYQVFQKLMWISTILYAGEGAVFLGDVLRNFPFLWWFSALVMIALGVFVLRKFPCAKLPKFQSLWCLGLAALQILILSFLPEIVFLRDKQIWGTNTEYKQAASYRAAYNTLYDAQKVYDICGLYHLTYRDVWQNELYPLTPAYRSAQKKSIQDINIFLSQKDSPTPNDMTGIYAGKNVVLVLMESMDDWMITEKETPTICKLMNEGINFTQFYTPGYGSARTLNSEFCMNTGIYLPTTGSYLFDYVTNSFNQSFANQLTDNGYSAEVFHYNDPDFYSRGVFEPVMGYNAYNCYGDYVEDTELLKDDCLLFDIPQTNELFFREGQTLNTIITRSAHLGYVYHEVLSQYALERYPEYRGMYASEEEDCARLKAKLVDEMFARLLSELEANGQLKNTVIVAMTDHYTYGYNNEEELYAHSQVDEKWSLEKTPCFIWSADGPALEVSKILNTADLVPTVLNLMGVESPYAYLGSDAFDKSYEGYVIFPDGSWIADGIVYDTEEGILCNDTGSIPSEEYLASMEEYAQAYVRVNNLLLTTDYYKKIQ